MKEKSFEQLINELKGALNEQIKPEASKEEIDKIAALSSTVDDITTAYNTVKGDYDELKNDYIKVVKNQSFKVDHDPMDDILEGGQDSDKLINKIFGL